MVVLFEGIDTCGKSTQITLLAEKYPNILTTYEPGATAFGKQAREILLADTIHSKRAELLLFLADRAEHYAEVILTHTDKTVISDRGFLSGIGYALAHGDFDFETLLALNRFALQDDLPEKIILFLTDLDTLQKRTAAKSLDSIELRGLAYLMEVQRHMQESLKKLDIDHLLVDAREPIEEIHQKIVSYLGL